jgi:hypothetical protein
MYDDAKSVNKFVTKLVDDGKEIIIIAHIYGGEPSILYINIPRRKHGLYLGNIDCAATESLKYMTKKEREQRGKSGGVVRVAYLTAAVPRLGESCGRILVGGKGAPSM